MGTFIPTLLDPTSMIQSFARGQQIQLQQDRLNQAQQQYDIQAANAAERLKVDTARLGLDKASLMAEMAANKQGGVGGTGLDDITFDDNGNISAAPYSNPDQTSRVPADIAALLGGQPPSAQDIALAAGQKSSAQNAVDPSGLTPELLASLGIQPGATSVDARALSRTPSTSERLPGGGTAKIQDLDLAERKFDQTVKSDEANLILKQADMELKWEAHQLNYDKLDLDERKFLLTKMEAESNLSSPAQINNLARQVSNTSMDLSDIPDKKTKIQVMRKLAEDGTIIPDKTFLRDLDKMRSIGVHIDRMQSMVDDFRQATKRGDVKAMEALSYSYESLKEAMATPVAKASGETRITDQDVKRFTAIMGTGSLRSLALDSSDTVRRLTKEHYETIYTRAFEQYEDLRGGTLTGLRKEDGSIPNTTPDNKLEIQGGDYSVLKDLTVGTQFLVDGTTYTLTEEMSRRLQ